MNIIISNTSDTPIYEQIVQCIQRDIINGVLSEGDALPSIRTLAKDLSVSVITTKKAYEELESKGYIETRPGKGSFVSKRSGSLAREHKQSQMEQHLLNAIDISKELNLSYEEFLGIIELLYKEVD